MLCPMGHVYRVLGMRCKESNVKSCFFTATAVWMVLLFAEMGNPGYRIDGDG